MTGAADLARRLYAALHGWPERMRGEVSPAPLALCVIAQGVLTARPTQRPNTRRTIRLCGLSTGHHNGWAATGSLPFTQLTMWAVTS